MASADLEFSLDVFHDGRRSFGCRSFK